MDETRRIVVPGLREASFDSEGSALEERLAGLPDSPGVYLHKDAVGRVLYVGKATRLRQRVRSYFQPGAQHSRRIAWLVSRVADVEVILVDTPVEALVLECHLIKTHRPYFNVKYRDDKRYPLLEVTTSETYPKFRVVRRPKRKDHRYFGPYPDAGALRRTVKLLRKIFAIRTCKLDMSKVAERPCLDYHIKLCTAPCTRYVTPEQYSEQVQGALEFLEGRSDGLIRRLKQRMAERAAALDFEACAQLRDTLQDVESVVEKQHVVWANSEHDEDYLGLASEGETVSVHLLMVRGGKLTDQRSFLLDAPGEAPPSEQISAFIKEHYALPLTLPKTILVSALPEDHRVLADWLSERAGRKVILREPVRGARARMLGLALKNAKHHLDSAGLKRATDRPQRRRRALEELAGALGLRGELWRLECVDISNTHGKQAVGSLVVFENGLPRTDQYRRFRIRSGDTPDDFRMMHEVLSRRFSDRSDSRKYSALPDLLIVDGGKGQLSSAVRALEEFGYGDRAPVVGLAKQRELLYLPDRSEPVELPRDSEALAVVTHLRDEAHRFAVTYHRKLRQKVGRSSALDDIPGLGEVKKQNLMLYFGSLKTLRQATPEEIARAPGIGPKLSQKVHRALHAGGG